MRWAVLCRACRTIPTSGGSSISCRSGIGWKPSSATPYMTSRNLFRSIRRLKTAFSPTQEPSWRFQSKKSEDFAAVYRLLRANGIKPLVVKGISCRILWRNPDARPSGDEDLLLRPDELNACLAVLSENGYEISSDSPEITCFSPLSGLSIELHSSLFPTDSPYFSCFNRCFEDVFDSCVPFTAAETEFFMPEPTLFLLYLFLHALKHFVHSGVGIRQPLRYIAVRRTLRKRHRLAKGEAGGDRAGL